MNRLNKRIRLVFVIFIFSFMSCSHTEDKTSDNQSKSTRDNIDQNHSLKFPSGKKEEIDEINNPAQFQIPMLRRIQNLRRLRSGESTRKPFPSTWWPQHFDGIAWRWAGDSQLSPAEKYDLLAHSNEIALTKVSQPKEDPKGNVVNPSGGVEREKMIGPTTLWEMRYHGTWGDAYPFIWWGHCNGWSSYTLNEREPKHSVTVKISNPEDSKTMVTCQSDREPGCVRFEVADINALMTELYQKDASHKLAGRCEQEDPKADDHGRVVDSDCRDVNPAALHIVTTNMLGIYHRMFVADFDYRWQVWNYPVYRFEVTTLNEVSAADAMHTIGIDSPNYQFDPKAVKFFDVALKLWIVDDSIPPSTKPAGNLLDRYTTIRTYTYILEVASDGKVLGGEYTGDSKQNHPDFLWYSYNHSPFEDDDDLGDGDKFGHGDNPNIRYSIVKKILSLSQE